MRERAVFYTNIWVLIDGSIADLLSMSWKISTVYRDPQDTNIVLLMLSKTEKGK